MAPRRWREVDSRSKRGRELLWVTSSGQASLWSWKRALQTERTTANAQSQGWACITQEPKTPSLAGGAEDTERGMRWEQWDKQGPFVSMEWNLDFILCVVRHYWNVLNREVICIFKKITQASVWKLDCKETSTHERPVTRLNAALLHLSAHLPGWASWCFHFYWFQNPASKAQPKPPESITTHQLKEPTSTSVTFGFPWIGSQLLY